MIAPNEKYLQKMLKKICRYQNLLYLCIVIKSNNIMKATKKSKFDRLEEISEYVEYTFLTLLAVFMSLALLF